MKVRVSLLMIVLLLIQMVSPGIAPLQTASSEQNNAGNELFDFDNLSDDSYSEEDGHFYVYVDWSLENYQIDEVDRSVEFSTPLKFIDQAGDLFDEESIASFTTSEDKIIVSFNELALENPDAKGTVKLELDLIETTEAEAVLNEPAEESTGVESFNAGLHKELDGNIFEFVSLEIDGQSIMDGDIIEIEENTVANLKFGWNTEGLNAKAGDTASIRLSDAFEMVSVSNQPIKVEDTTVGTYHIENGVLIFEFNENIEDDHVQNGWVDLGLEFNLDKFRENVKQEIPFHDGHNQNITVIAKPYLNHSGIAKEGRPDNQHDAREITWTIDVINTNDEEITDAFLADNIPAGLGEAKDFVIHELSVGFEGDIRQGANVTEALNPTEFEIDLGTVTPFNGYRIQYKTPIENYALDSFTNEATFEYGATKLPAEATVGGLTRSNPIEKNGWQVGDDDVIQWQIDVNKNGSLISDAIVYDNLPAGLTIDPDTIEVVRISQTGGDWIEGDAHEKSFTKLPIELGALGQEDAYRVRFKTTVDWEEVNKGNYQQNNGFQNEATLYDGEDELNADDEKVNIERDPMLRKTGVSNVDYNNKTVTWTIHINEAGHPLGNVILTDLIPEGLKIDKGDIKITDGEGNDYTPNSINLSPTADNKTEVIIDLGNVGTKQLKVEYTTEITDFTINNFKNEVGMTGDGIGPNGENDNDTISPAGNTYSKNFAGIDYNKKTIDWRLNVNPVREDINTGFVITDTFTNDGLILLPDTVDIKLGQEKLEKGTDYTLAPIDDGYQNGFTITFDREIADGELVVEFTTSYDPELEVDGNLLTPHSKDNEKEVYRNKAEFDGETENGHTIDEEDDANHKVRVDSWNSGKKEGQLVHFDDEGKVRNGWASGAERKIAWQLYINYLEQDLGTGVVVTDELDYPGDIDADSIRVSVYDVESDGKTKITGPVLESVNYSVNTDEDGKFILTFADDFEVTERYVIEFTTSVPDISEYNYTNNATVKVGDVESDYSATVDYEEHDDFLAKRAVNAEGNRVFTGDEVEWEVRVNESLSIIKEAVITDTISAGHVYLNGSLEIYKSQNLENPLIEGSDYTLDVVPATDGNDELTGATNLVIEMIEDLQDTLVLKYITVVTETDGTIGNSISLDGTAFDQKSIESGEIRARQFGNVGGEWSRSRGAIRLTKVDAETGDTIANNEVEAKFELWYELNDEKQRFGEEEYTTENGILEIGNLPFRTYYLKEATAPDGYVLSEDYLEIVVNTAIGNDLNSPNFAEATFENMKEKVNITGTKEWIGGEALRPDSIELQLLRDGEPYDEPVTLVAGETEYTWTDLDKTDIDGNEYKYTVDEVEVPSYFVNSTDGLKVTNTFESPLIDIPVEKVWEDEEDQDGKRSDSVEVQLFANDDQYGDPITLSAATEWKGVFTDLPEYDETGKEIEYTFEELNVHEDYQVDINDEDLDKVIITNSYTPEVTEVEGTKIWEDANNQDGVRPDEIKVNLLANGFKVAEQVVKADEDGNWNYEFTDLPKFSDGEEITYTITENTVEGYSTRIEGYNVRNSYTPEERSITVTKAWDDGNNQDGKRADSIEVQLFANDNPLGEPITLSDENDWTHTWTGLAVNEAGEEIEYTFEELNVPEGYQVNIDAEDLGNVIITNTHTPEVINILGEKIWDDADNQDGIRPEFITVNLLADGEQIDSKEVTSADNWNYQFEGLPRFEAGEEIEYTVLEDEVDGYEVTYDGFEITNSYTPETTEVAGTKTWDDADNQDGVRPDSITVNLLADGEQVDSLEVTEDSGWTYRFTELPKYKAGEEIVYTVTENTVEGYTRTIDGFNITNHYTPGKTSVTVTKNWDDGNNQDGIRPETIEVQLTADGEAYGELVELSEDNNWTYTWTELDEKAAGETIVYSVVEQTELAEYEVTIDDEDHGNIIITNSYTPEITEVAGTKIWDDADNQDGVRPDSIIVRLLANGEEVDFVEVTAETDWQFEFTDLPKFANGEEINYTVQEDDVADYSTIIDGFDITNSYTPGKTSINVVKVWDDQSNQAGIRPDQITVILFANGEKTDHELILTADGNWQGDFTDLDTHQNGVAIEYTIEEVAVEGYQTEIKGTSENGFVITNSHDPEDPETPTEEPRDPTDGKEEPSGEGNLPKTATNLFNLLVIGLGLLISGIVLILISNRKRRLEN